MTSKLKLLTRDEILALDDRATEVVEVPEWGGAVTLRAMTGSERDQYEASMVRYGKDDKGQIEVKSVETANIRARLVSLAAVDEQGERMFKEADLLALGDKSAAALNRLFDVARRLSALTDQDVEALKTGLKAGPNGSSGSD